MSDSVLVAYVTKYGSTQEVAEKIAATLRGQGLSVDVQPAKQMWGLEQYQAVVFGAPLYIGHWLKDAKRFLKKHQAALTEMPIAVFSLGPTHGTDEAEWEGVRAQLNQELAKYPWLKPVVVELFGGKYDPKNLRFPDALLAKVPASPLHGAPATDLRDWDAIQAWAAALPAKLEP
jgi:menaquinone-dependent protoporphyrinogen oxidase